jgi:hypothetical protein
MVQPGVKMEMKISKFVFWIYKQKKYLSFHSRQGYESVYAKTSEEMWELIHLYIETGYKVY